MVRPLRRATVRAMKLVWHHASVASLARFVRGERGVILRYHSVTGDEATTLEYLDHGLMVTGEAFAAQLDYIKRRYTVIPLDDMVDRIHAARPLPPRAAAITFDDGYRDNYTHAFPLLRAAGLPATFYVTTGSIDGGPPLWTAKLRYMVRNSRKRHVVLPQGLGPAVELNGPADRQATFTRLIVALKQVQSPERLALVGRLAEAFEMTDFAALDDIMMTWQELREMSANGMTIGAHTVTHPNLPRTEPDEVRYEVCESRDAIAGKLRVPVGHFSYPNGRGSSHLNDVVRDIVRQAGFQSAVTSLPGCVQAGVDPWALRRIGIYNRHREMPSFSLDVERGRLRTA